VALFTPVEELPDPGINIIKILSLPGILQFNGRNFTFCRALIYINPMVQVSHRFIRLSLLCIPGATRPECIIITIMRRIRECNYLISRYAKYWFNP